MNYLLDPAKINPVSKFTPKIRREKTLLCNTDPVKKKDLVNVFCRLYPTKDNEESKCIKVLPPTTLALTTPIESKIIRKEIHCEFKHIFTGSTRQKEVFQHVAYPLLEDLFQGKNGLLFTYGVTGSGKTYTLTGDENNPGIMPQCIYAIFNTISNLQPPSFVIKSDRMNGFEVQSLEDAKQDQLRALKSNWRTPIKDIGKKKEKFREKSYADAGTKVTGVSEDNLYSVFISYTEIYNNNVLDLLDENTGKNVQGKILREDSQKNMYVNGVVEIEVKTAEEAFRLFNIGQKRKKMANTNLNPVSSRSHSIFNIRVVQFQQRVYNEEGQPMVPDCNLLKIAQLSLVDLAGSERTNRTRNKGQQLREASKINNSLLSLRTCLEILRENQLTGSNRLIPYRDSRLTLLFKNYFEGEGRIQMIVCINPSIEDFEENLQVVKFAEITRDVKVARAEPKFTPCKKKVQNKPKTPLPSKSDSVLPVGLELPTISLKFNSLEESQNSLERLLTALRSRSQEMDAVALEVDRKKSHFRKRMIEVQQENVSGRSEINSIRTLFMKEKQRRKNVESKLEDLETHNKDLNMKIVCNQEELSDFRSVIAKNKL